MGEIQGRTPEKMHVVRPGVDFKPETFRVEEYGAYYRLVRRWLLDAIATPRRLALSPALRRVRGVRLAGHLPGSAGAQDDHLTLVAGMTVQQAAGVRAPGDHDAGTAGLDPGAAAGTARARRPRDVRTAPGTGPGAARRPEDRPSDP